MTQTKKLIALCQDLATDETVDLLPEVRREITQLTFAAIGECKSVERELGPVAHDEAREEIFRDRDKMRVACRACGFKQVVTKWECDVLVAQVAE